MAADTLADPPAGAPARQRLHAPIATLDADALDPDEIAATLRFAAAARSANTRLAYAADWTHFVTWCAERGASPLPCPPGLMAGYLAALAASGLRASTISRRAAGVAHVHRMNGHTPPTASEAVRAVLRGIRHSLGTAPSPKAPATHDVIARMIAACPTTSLIGLRDRALTVLRSLSLDARPFSSILSRRHLGLGVGQLGVQLLDPVTQSVGAGSLGVPALLRPFLVLLGPLGACIGRLRTLQCRVGVGELGLHHVEAVS
jgi:hypothetical protein